MKILDFWYWFIGVDVTHIPINSGEDLFFKNEDDFKKFNEKRQFILNDREECRNYGIDYTNPDMKEVNRIAYTVGGFYE